MNFSVSLLNKAQVPGDRDFTVRDIGRHFNSWRQQFRGSSFTLRWIGNNLTLTTNCPELLDMWWRFEQGYVEHLLNSSLGIPEEVTVLADSPRASHFITAA